MIPRIMERGGFQIKIMIQDGESRPEVLKKFGGTALGMPLDMANNNILMKPKVNLST